MPIVLVGLVSMLSVFTRAKESNDVAENSTIIQCLANAASPLYAAATFLALTNQHGSGLSMLLVD
jgi:hypothetical protein